MNIAEQFSYQGAKVLVTGASGFIGTHLCRHLSALGAEVTGVYLHNLPSEDHATWVKADLTQSQAVSDLIRRESPDFIFHLASYVQGWRELDAVQPTFENNLLSTINVLTAAQQASGCKRLVLTNSQEEPDEDDKHMVPSSPYAAAKFAASTYARMFHALYALPVVIARVFMVYGPEQKELRRLVPYAILNALKGESPDISSGQRKVDWIYVEDVVEGLLKLGSEPGVEGETIDLGTGQFHTVKQVVEEVLLQINPKLEGKYGAIADRAMEQERLARVDESDDKINWRAKVSLRDGLAHTIEYYRHLDC